MYDNKDDTSRTSARKGLRTGPGPEGESEEAAPEETASI